MLRDGYDTLEFWNGIQWEIRMIPFKTAGSTLVSAGRTLYYLGTLHERHYELLNASNTFNLWRMNDNMVFLAVTKIVSIQPGEYYSTLILPLSFLTDCDGIPHCIGYCIYICFIFVLICKCCIYMWICTNYCNISNCLYIYLECSLSYFIALGTSTTTTTQTPTSKAATTAMPTTPTIISKTTTPTMTTTPTTASTATPPTATKASSKSLSHFFNYWL